MNEGENCIFCKIVNNEIPSTKVYENEKVLAFLDITPINKGHVLVIPKVHSENIYEIEDEILSEIIKISKKLSISIKKSLNADGINVIMNNDYDAGQRVFHAHFHIIPRYKNDGYEMWQSKTNYQDNEKIETAEKIKSILL